MRLDRFYIPLMLAPAMAVLIVLFGGGLAYGLAQSLGWNALTNSTDLSLDAYTSILQDERFWVGLAFTFWISIASTVISAILAIGLALVIRTTQWGKRFATFLLQFNLPIPHLVAAIGVIFLLDTSGIFARLFVNLGIIERISDFPILVKDKWGIGIIITYVWKEVPFIGVIVLAVLQSLGQSYEQAALNLGASMWQRFRYITLPLILPSVLSASVIVFAFTFGSYEVPRLLEFSRRRTLPVQAIRFFNNADLAVRAEAMAMSILIALIVMVLVIIYMWLRDHAEVQR